jgi:hypothetical protein
MPGLEMAFYIVGIVFMGVMLILVFALLTAVLVIKAKVNHMHKMVSEKVDNVKDVAAKLTAIFGTVRHFVKR